MYLNESDEKPKIYNEIIAAKNNLNSFLSKLEKSIYENETKYLESVQYA